jgi:hypothetical protein
MPMAEKMEGGAVVARNIQAFGALCRRLDPGWRAIYNRCVEANGEKYCVHAILIHRDYGIGLIVFSRESSVFPETALRVTRNMLREKGFERSFGHSVPLVFIALDPENSQSAPAQIGHAFSAAPPVAIRDPNWVEWVTDALDRVPSFEEAATAERAPVAPPRPRRWLSRALWGASSLAVAAALLLGGASLYARSPALHNGVVGQALGWAHALGGYVSAELNPQPPGRLMTEKQAAAYLGLEPDAFRAKLTALGQHGFPQPERVTGNFDKAAIDRWLDRQRTSRRDAGK